MNRTVGIRKSGGNKDLAHATSNRKGILPWKAGIVAEWRGNRETGGKRRCLDDVQGESIGTDNFQAGFDFLLALVAPLL